MASRWWNRKQADEAITAFRKAIELNPKRGDTLFQLAVLLADRGNVDEAIACLRSAVELNPKYAGAHTTLAWYLATAADPKLRDPKAAVVHARTAVDPAPKTPNHWGNLGVASPRAGDAKASVETLEKADQMWASGDQQHRFFLAIAYWQLDDQDKARRAYEQGAEWMDRKQPPDEGFRRFRAEAAGLLRIGEQQEPVANSRPRRGAILSDVIRILSASAQR